MKSLIESLFDDNIKNDIIIHGEKVDHYIWNLCKKSFDWFRKKIIKGQKTYEFEEYGVREVKHDIIYNEDDCILMTDKLKTRITIMCPETIWYNFINNSLGEIQISGDSIDEHHPINGFYCRTFAMKKNGSFFSLEYPRGKNITGYIPETISDKAKKIIKNF